VVGVVVAGKYISTRGLKTMSGIDGMHVEQLDAGREDLA
jgi:hypothetical protein